jgi:hypothetical protein
MKDIPGMTKPSFNINAAYSGAVRSVEYWYGGTKYRVEAVAPFAFCGNNRADFFSCPKLGCGNHTVWAVPFSRGGAQGEAGPRYAVSFSVACSSPPKLAVTGLTLVNADKDTKVLDLANGTVV